MKNILITGYEPFGGDTFNPSLALAKELSGTIYKDYEFQYVEIPVSRKRLPGVIIGAIEKYKPEVIICTGLAYERAMISVERVAINVTDFPFPDMDGYLSLNEAIDPEGPTAYFSSLPLRRIKSAVEKEGIPIFVSNSAGTYCCNMIMYTVLNYIKKNNLSTKAGMMHVPYTPEMVIGKDFKMPSMSLDLMKKAVYTAAKTSVDYADDDNSVICGFAQ